MADRTVSAMAELLANQVDINNDYFYIVDVSEPDLTDRSKRIKPISVLRLAAPRILEVDINTSPVVIPALEDNIFVGSGSFGATKVFNIPSISRFTLIVEISNTSAFIEFECDVEGVTFTSSSALWNHIEQRFELSDVGHYKIKGDHDGNRFFLDIYGAYYPPES